MKRVNNGLKITKSGKGYYVMLDGYINGKSEYTEQPNPKTRTFICAY